MQTKRVSDAALYAHRKLFFVLLDNDRPSPHRTVKTKEEVQLLGILSLSRIGKGRNPPLLVNRSQHQSMCSGIRLIQRSVRKRPTNRRIGKFVEKRRFPNHDWYPLL